MRATFLARLLVIMVVVGVIAAACGDSTPSDDATTSTTSAPTEPEASPLRLAMVVHHDEPIEASPFWSLVALGALEAADEVGVEVALRGDQDPAAQGRIIEVLVADGIDGIIASLADPTALGPALSRAEAADVPIITINSGFDSYLDTPALTHVGQSEFAAGRAIGSQLNSMGLSGPVLCIIQEFNNVGLEQRCDGLEAAYDGGIERFRENMGVTTPPETAALIGEALQESNYAALVTLDPFIALVALDAIEVAESDVVLTAFDVVPEILEAIRSGRVAFTIDQDAYRQGYEAVKLLADHIRNGTTPDRESPVESGPVLIDGSNVDEFQANAACLFKRVVERFAPPFQAPLSGDCPDAG